MKKYGKKPLAVEATRRGAGYPPDTRDGHPSQLARRWSGVPTVKVLYYIEIFILIKKTPTHAEAFGDRDIVLQL